MVSFFVQSFVPYYASRDRIANLWSQDELEEYLVKKDDDDDTIYEFKNATMSWANPKRLAAEEAKKQEEEANRQEGVPDESQKSDEEKNESEELIKTNFKLKEMNFKLQRGE